MLKTIFLTMAITFAVVYVPLVMLAQHLGL